MSRYLDPAPVRRTAHLKQGVIVAARLGSPTHPHALVVAGTRHDYLGGQMQLTKLELELVAAVPGSVGALADMLVMILPKAEQRAREGLGKHMLVLDVTRQPQAYKLLSERITIDAMLLVTTHGRMMPSVPYWSVGRVTLLSHLSVQLSRPGVVTVPEPASDSPTVWRPAQVRDALSAAQARPPKDEPDAFVVDTTTGDDVALAIAVAAQWAELGAPDPWVEAPAYAAA